MAVESSITAQTFILGKVRVDALRVRGEGGPVNPALIVPFDVALNPRPHEHRLAITEVWGRVHLAAPAPMPLGEMVRALSPSNPQGLWASIPRSEASYGAEFRFPLTAEQLRSLEDRQPKETDVPLKLELRVALAWVRSEHSDQLGHGMSAVELLPLPWVRADELRLTVPVTQWTGPILSGLGVDRLRTVLLQLPTDNPFAPDKPLVTWFDDARSRYDRGDTRGCIERCRDVRRAVEIALHATRNDPVSAKVATAGGLPAGTTHFVDGVWKALAEVTNQAHHPEDTEPAYSDHDARAVLLTTAVMLEYLSNLMKPTPLR